VLNPVVGTFRFQKAVRQPLLSFVQTPRHSPNLHRHPWLLLHLDPVWSLLALGQTQLLNHHLWNIRVWPIR